jgi:AraC-like DNA-binding protein
MSASGITGCITIWEGGSLWVFDVPPSPRAIERTAAHTHHALQLTFALDGDFRLHVNGEVLGGPAALVAADAPHVFEADGVVALLFVEPESVAGRRLTRRLLSDHGAAALPVEMRAGLLQDDALAILAAFRREPRDRPALLAAGQRLCARLGSAGLAPDTDVRVRRMIDWAATQLEGTVTVAAAARHVGLSAGRASHLFVAQTGLAFRTYVLWLRLMRALERYAAGRPLTEAAHAAGFADSAHLSRTFRRMFGLPATVLELR